MPGVARSLPPLAGRLVDLRSSAPGGKIAQAAVREVLGVSAGLLSSWENGTAQPSDEWLLEYATVFATPRSRSGRTLRRLPDDDLTSDERALRDQLYADLLALRSGPGPVVAPTRTWHFPDGGPIRLVCGRLAESAAGAYADPLNPNYTQTHAMADSDALIELFGHVRMTNPDSDVRFLFGDEMSADDLTAHVVLLGGLEQNPAARFFLTRDVSLPVEQVADDEVEDGEVFRLTGDQPGRRRRFLPNFFDADPALGLVEDVGMFARMPNPNFQERTLTFCSGVYSAGVVGAVRTFTDLQLRDSNERYLADRFRGADSYGLLLRVPVFQGSASTPDLGNDNHRLFSWPAREAREESS